MHPGVGHPSIGLRLFPSALRIELGQNRSGQLGQDPDGDGSDETLPILVDTGPLNPGADFVSLAAGRDHSCGISDDGVGICWGSAVVGEIGTGNNQNVTIPTLVDVGRLNPGTRLTSIAPGDGHSCARANDDAAYCWGLNNGCQVGDGTITGRLAAVPVIVDALQPDTHFISISAGLSLGGESHSCSVSNEGAAYCSGRDDRGQLGEVADGDKLDELIPVLVGDSAVQ